MDSNIDISTSSEEDSESEQTYSTPSYTPKPGFFEKSPLNDLADETDKLLTPVRSSSSSAKAIEKEELWKLVVERNKKRPSTSPLADQNNGKMQRTRSLSFNPKFNFKRRDTVQAEKVFTKH